jgi:hypothetical protein
MKWHNFEDHLSVIISNERHETFIQLWVSFFLCTLLLYIALVLYERPIRD